MFLKEIESHTSMFFRGLYLFLSIGFVFGKVCEYLFCRSCVLVKPFCDVRLQWWSVFMPKKPLLCHVWLQDPPWHLQRLPPHLRLFHLLRWLRRQGHPKGSVCHQSGGLQVKGAPPLTVGVHRFPLPPESRGNRSDCEDKGGLCVRVGQSEGTPLITRQKRITIFRNVSNVSRMNFCEGGFIDQHEQLLLEHVGGGLSL
ncbi:hypothetical protein QJS10_CPA16g00374 [Acorus calamus]|uniref:Uncharacterized protein n=1 Tax=Acorus calamus TaxID=4465 RepID=A0AAV9D3W1_ACOCL|nr:hypothetical protein QJS10_CPA16g00374 [Acorus calamus]